MNTEGLSPLPIRKMMKSMPGLCERKNRGAWR